MNVTNTTSATGAPGPAGTTLQTDPTKSAVFGLGKDDFMKLFLAQLENQDPMQPADDSQMLSEMAQFTMIDTLQQVSTALAGTQLAQASALIGKHIDGLDSTGAKVSGTVTQVAQSSDTGIVLMVGDQTVKPSDIQTVTDPSSDASTTASSTAPNA